MNDKITFQLLHSSRGKVLLTLYFPNGVKQRNIYTKAGNAWHTELHLFADGDKKLEAYLYSINKIHLSNNDVRRLRKNGSISFAAPDRKTLFAWWKDVRATRKGMYLRPGFPNLANA